jgi:hypothetical protein
MVSVPAGHGFDRQSKLRGQRTAISFCCIYHGNLLDVLLFATQKSDNFAQPARRCYCGDAACGSPRLFPDYCIQMFRQAGRALARPQHAFRPKMQWPYAVLRNTSLSAQTSRKCSSMSASHIHPSATLNGHTAKRQRTTSSKDMSALIDRLSKLGNPALHVNAEHKIELRETEVPTPSPHEALIHVRCTGICESINRLELGS